MPGERETGDGGGEGGSIWRSGAVGEGLPFWHQPPINPEFLEALFVFQMGEEIHQLVNFGTGGLLLPAFQQFLIGLRVLFG